MSLIFARFLDTLAKKQIKNIKLPKPWFIVGTVFLCLKASLFSVKQRQCPCDQEIYSFISSHHGTDDQNFTSLSNCLFTKDRRALFHISWRSWRKGSFLCLQIVKPFFLNVLCSVDLKILINVMLTSNLVWNWLLTQFFRRFFAEVSVSWLVFHSSWLSETLCISSIWPEKSKQEPKTPWMWPYTSFNSCEHQQFAFSDPHWALHLLPCWLQCYWKRNVNFSKWANSF